MLTLKKENLTIENSEALLRQVDHYLKVQKINRLPGQSGYYWGNVDYERLQFELQRVVDHKLRLLPIDIEGNFQDGNILSLTAKPKISGLIYTCMLIGFLVVIEVLTGFIFIPTVILLITIISNLRQINSDFGDTIRLIKELNTAGNKMHM